MVVEHLVLLEIEYDIDPVIGEYGESELVEQSEPFEQDDDYVEDPEQPVERNTEEYSWAWADTNPATEADMSWYDQFEQLFYGEQPEQPEQPEQSNLSTEREEYYQQEIIENEPAYSYPTETNASQTQQVLFYQPQETENETTSNQVNFINADQCIHTYNIINTVEEVIKNN